MNRIGIFAFLVPLIFTLSLVVWKKSDMAIVPAPELIAPLIGREGVLDQENMADATSLIGVASVIDGDTIEIHGNRIRLNGIDAPESDQTCILAGETYSCGRKASLFLSDIIGTRQVSCKPQSKDRYGRIIATCESEGRDLGAAMVAFGWALAYRQYDRVYEPQESDASEARVGMWAGAFVEPWLWRKGQRLGGQ